MKLAEKILEAAYGSPEYYETLIKKHEERLANFKKETEKEMKQGKKFVNKDNYTNSVKEWEGIIKELKRKLQRARLDQD